LKPPASLIDALRSFAIAHGAFNDSVPLMWVDVVQLESNPAFIRIVAQAQELLNAIEHSRAGMRQIEDDIVP